MVLYWIIKLVVSFWKKKKNTKNIETKEALKMYTSLLAKRNKERQREKEFKTGNRLVYDLR